MVRASQVRLPCELSESRSSAAYMYTFGSAGTSSTYRNNLEALEQWRIIPRMLRNATDRNLEVSAVICSPWSMGYRADAP